VLEPEDGGPALTVRLAEPVADGPGWWLEFGEVGDRDAADRLRDRYLTARVDPAELPAGEVYWHEVVGCPVVDAAGADLGRVVDIFRVGGAEVLVVEGPLGELDIPNVASIVLEFAPRDGRIVVDRESLDLDAAPPPKRPRGRRTRRAHDAARLAGDVRATTGGPGSSDGGGSAS
jgi:16S rRNA processing protein RimM